MPAPPSSQPSRAASVKMRIGGSAASREMRRGRELSKNSRQNATASPRPRPQGVEAVAEVGPCRITNSITSRDDRAVGVDVERHTGPRQPERADGRDGGIHEDVKGAPPAGAAIGPAEARPAFSVSISNKMINADLSKRNKIVGIEDSDAGHCWPRG